MKEWKSKKQGARSEESTQNSLLVFFLRCWLVAPTLHQEKNSRPVGGLCNNCGVKSTDHLCGFGEYAPARKYHSVENVTESYQIAADSGGKRLLLPMASVRDIPTIPGELFAKFQTSFYSDPIDPVFKAFGMQ